MIRSHTRPQIHAIMSHRYPTRFQLHTQSMSHRYPTRFQLKKTHATQPRHTAQAAQLQAQPRHTAQAAQAARVQAVPIQAQPRQADVVQDQLTLMRQQSDSSAVVNYFLARAAASTSVLDKVLETIKLFEYLYEHPVLLTTHLRFKDVVWHKMAQLDKELTDALMRLPSTLDIDLYVLATRTNIARLHNLMNMIRQKYY